MIHTWWSEREGEQYWLEVTGRNDLGANLKAPQTNEKGEEYWSYSLINYVQGGDIVFHYQRLDQAIIACSRATGEVWEDNLMRAARGSSARNAGIEPHLRLGWYLGLEGFSLIKQPITLDQIRVNRREFVNEIRLLASEVGEPLYFPFELGEKRPMLPMQGYLFKLPSFFLDKHFSSLTHVAAVLGDEPKDKSKATESLGTSYRPADEETSVAQKDPFSVDPALVERGLRGHARTQNLLSTYLTSIGIEPRSPRPDEPNFDIAWSFQSITWVAEVKSLSNENEEKQLRLGLGQLLRYRQLLGKRHKVRAMLLAERCPTDPAWRVLCSELGIILTWPADLPNSLRL